MFLTCEFLLVPKRGKDFLKLINLEFFYDQLFLGLELHPPSSLVISQFIYMYIEYVCNRNYVTNDLIIPLVTYVIFYIIFIFF